jgi:hypothetical protein
MWMSQFSNVHPKEQVAGHMIQSKVTELRLRKTEPSLKQPQGLVNAPSIGKVIFEACKISKGAEFSIQRDGCGHASPILQYKAWTLLAIMSKLMEGL